MKKTSKFHALGLAGALLAGPVALPAATAASPVISHEARLASPLGLHGHGGIHSTWAASNWSGYAETGTFAGVSGTWTVPSVSATSSASYSAAWVGVDGFSNSNLIQTGTEQDYYNGAAHYDAWWEILPAAETEISPSYYPVSPGDRMSASIYETTPTISSGGRHQRQTGREWVITISDQSHGWSFTTDQAYSGPGTSAEWIMEAPEVGGRIASLAHYTVTPPTNTGDFDNAGILTTPVSAGTPTYKGAALNYANDSGVMIQNGAQVSTPGNPDGALSAYNVAYGPTVPATPAG
jgi:Peptidase A4 family